MSTHSVAEVSDAKLQSLSRISLQIRRWILRCTTEAGSGHPTSSLSAVELMTALFFGGSFRYDLRDPKAPNNDRLIFSKGHASPLFYSLWAAARQADVDWVLSEDELMTYRKFGSRLEGHPTSRFPFTEAATGSLGQGLSIGFGMALNAKYLDKLPYRTYVLLGDSEMAEGSQWEAIQLASHYRLGNLIGILDVNRLGQRGETMQAHDLIAYQRRIEAFGWRTIMIDDGHDLDQVLRAYDQVTESSDQPTMLIAWTVKGKGVSFLENQDGWHGKSLDDKELKRALDELGEVDDFLRGELARPSDDQPDQLKSNVASGIDYSVGDEVATRDAFGHALQRIGDQYPSIVSLDGEVSNSTRAEYFAEKYPDRFFEMYIAEQNMVGAAVGLSLRGKLPFVSTFAAFLTRAFDQIRMARHSEANIKLVGSHSGVSIGQDGPSQMGLEDIAMMRTIQDSVVLYPCDAVSTQRLVEAMVEHEGISYLRTTRGKTPVIYENDAEFVIGGSYVLQQSDDDRVTVVAAGITVHEALEAARTLRDKDQLAVRVIDLYSIKPMDHASLRHAADATEVIFTVEDHCPEGGIGEAVLTSLSNHTIPVRCLAVRKRPISGKPDQLLADEGISADAIIKAIRQFIAN